MSSVRAEMLAGLRRMVDEFEPEVGRLGDDPARLALLYADSWDHPYTLLDVARCAVALDRARRVGDRSLEADALVGRARQDFRGKLASGVRRKAALEQVASQYGRSVGTMRNWMRGIGT